MKVAAGVEYRWCRVCADSCALRAPHCLGGRPGLVWGPVARGGRLPRPEKPPLGRPPTASAQSRAQTSNRTR
eukprot:364905-Chlamydomonas_euryale.AAC.4